MARVERRWVALSDIVAILEERGLTSPTSRTLRRWCESGRIPSSKRGTDHWFLDMRRLKEMRSGGMEELYMDLVSSVNEEGR